MKPRFSRLFLLALAALFPLAPLSSAQTTASWKPTKVVRLVHDSTDYWEQNVEASERVVSAFGLEYDLKSGRADNAKGQILGVGEWTWLLYGGLNSRLELRNGDEAPLHFASPVKLSNDYYPALARLSLATNRVEMVSQGHYLRWQKTPPRLQLHTKLAQTKGVLTISPDGTKIIDARETEIVEISTKLGRVTKRIVLTQTDTTTRNPRLSPYGSTVIYQAPQPKYAQFSTSHRRVIDAASGRTLWRFNSDSATYNGILFSLDEKSIALPLFARKIWELRDLKTGAVLRTLPLIPNCDAGAFSPDGATLYSVANGVLYKQRAR